MREGTGRERLENRAEPGSSGKLESRTEPESGGKMESRTEPESGAERPELEKREEKEKLYCRIQAFFREHRQEFLEDVMEFIRIPSVAGPAEEGAPFGRENARILELAERKAEAFGLCGRTLEHYVTTADLFSGGRETQLDILAHLDVVPAGEGWTVTGPFEPVIRDGKLYGRGSSDDKGPAVAALYAMRAVKELKLPLSKNARLILGADEETACRDIKYYYERYGEAPCSFSPDAEYPLINVEMGGLYTEYSATWEESEQEKAGARENGNMRERTGAQWKDAANPGEICEGNTVRPRLKYLRGGNAGNAVPAAAEAVVEGLSEEQLFPVLRDLEERFGIRFETEEQGNEKQGGANPGRKLKIRALGRSAHASLPWEGNNAVTALLEAVCALPALQGKGMEILRGLSSLFPHNDYYGNGTGTAQEDDISGKLVISTNVIDYSEGRLYGKIDCRAPVCATEQSVLEVLRKKLSEKGIELSREAKMTPPHHVPGDTPFVKTLLSCYELVMGEKGSCLAVGGGTYAHRLKNGVAFGCMKQGIDYHMHGADEYMIVDDMIKSAELFALAIAEICR